MNFTNITSFFSKKTPISPKVIINRNGTAELTLSIDYSSTVAHLRILLTERLPDLSENEQFIHSNGAPIHILDEQDTIVSELLLEHSDVIFIKTKELMTAPDSAESFQNEKPNVNVQSTVLRNQQSALPMSNTSLVPGVDTIMLKIESGTKIVRLSDFLSSTKVEIDDAKLSPNDMKRIISGLKKNKKVHQLSIRSGYRHVIEILIEVLAVNRTLTHLYIGSGMNDADCISIANALITNRTLENLDLSRNAITSVGCKAIGELLKSNRTLKNLNICRNDLHDEGIKFICEALMMNKTLCQLDIYQTKMSISGCVLVAQMLQINQSLTLIDIGDNNLGSKGIIVIANALKHNDTLMELDTKWNKISEKGALALIDTLTTNHTLTTIKLHFNNIPEDVQKQINQKAPQLKTIGWDICFIL